MWKDPLVKSRSLGGVTDLTLLATIKPGFVPSLDAVTYKTRVKRLLRTLNAGRSSSHEYALLRPFSDAVERVGVIHSVRVAIVEPAVAGAEPDRLLLSVTFDGGAESYLRILWQKVGTLLDLIFCNTQDYVISHGSRFEDWAGWVRRVQIETDFFYGPPGVTMDDLRVLRADAALRRQPGLDAAAESLVSLRQTVHGAVEQAWAVADPQDKTGPERLEVIRLGFQSLVVLHRLAAVHLPGTPDGEVLRRAARSLLQEFLHAEQAMSLFDSLINEGDSRFDEQIRWIREPAAPEPGKAPPLPSAAPDWPRSAVQAGIVEPLPRQACAGALALLSFDTPAAAAGLLQRLLDDGWLSLADAAPAPGRPWLGLAFTLAGLQACGLSDDELEALPLEFRQGMPARASVLGDRHGNHPRRWTPPRRAGGVPVELETVHAVLHLRSEPADAARLAAGALDPALDTALQALQAGLAGVEILAVEPMARHLAGGDIVEHFGYADGLSGPRLAPDPAARYHSAQVHAGELLIGYDNAAEAAPPQPGGALAPLLQHGSYLVVRKLAQDVDAFERAIAQALKDHPDLDRATLRAKLMGRHDDGAPLATPVGADRNDFHYGDDPTGARCPLHAHIRRANPRDAGRLDRPPAEPGSDPLAPPPGGRPPVLARRGMSYGPRWQPGVPDSDAAPRGLMFMAYNASLGEQFEVVQRWLAGGNSTGLDSSQADPFVGVPEPGRPRTLRFEYTGRDDTGQPVPRIARIALDGHTAALADARPLVRLLWGLYALAPSRPALDWLHERARARAWTPPWSAARGAALIAQLQAVEARDGAAAAAEAWKTTLEDPQSLEDYRAADVWAAIRATPGGVLRTPYGVIVARRAGVHAVLGDKLRVSVQGYHGRMLDSMGEIFLGLDDTGPGCPYRRQAEKTREAIGRITLDHAFEQARGAAHATLDRLVADEQKLSYTFEQRHWELNLNLKELFDGVGQSLCEAWFGLDPAGRHLVPGGLRWDWEGGAPRYPGHFMAPSRYIFQPLPGCEARRLGQRDGRVLAEAFERALAEGWQPGADALVGRAIVDDLGADRALCARTLVGAIMGFVPTLDGTLRQTLHEWLRTGDFWALRERWAAHRAAGNSDRAAELLSQALMQVQHLRPSPELLWRTVTQPHRLGEVDVEPGDKLVLSLVSAMHEALAQGQTDLALVFGGQRGQAGEPTHACPGYDAARGATLGVLTALMERADTLRPSPAPLSITLEGELAIEPPGPGLFGLEKAVAKVGGAGTVLMVGDSWHQLMRGDQAQLALALKALGFAPRALSVPGAMLAGIRMHQLPRALREIESFGKTGRPLQAIVFCGGGNDVTHNALEELLHPAGHPAGPLNDSAVQAKVRVGFRAEYTQMLRALVNACDRHLPAPVPIFVHGYDHPVPDGRRDTGLGKPWLQSALVAQGHTDLAAGQLIMKTLIDELDGLQRDLAAAGSPFHGRIVHAPLVGVLSGELAGDAYRRDWRDELHATDAGMDKLARRLVEHMAAHIPTLVLSWP
jgi:deferrochelatase/peroxidase EfeB/lysophospholipase L1-like esterase